MVHRDLLDEFRYQGSLDLSEDTYRTISQLPMAIDSIAHARQNLIYRLDHYQSTDKFLFDSIIYLIQTEIYPIVFQHSHAGYAIYRTDSPFVFIYLFILLFIYYKYFIFILLFIYYFY